MKALKVILLIVVLLVATMLVLGKPFVLTKTATLGATEDATTDALNGTTNYGSDATVRVRKTGSAPPLSGGNGRAVIRWDFSSLVGVEQIQRATLILKLNRCVIVDSGAEGRDIAVWHVTDGVGMTGGNWAESTVTHNNYGSTFGATLLGTITMPQTCAATGSLFTLDVTSAVESWVVTGTTNRGLWLPLSDESATAGTSDQISYYFTSREGGTPLLEIQYVQSGEAPPEGVGEGTTNKTTNITPTGGPSATRLALAAFIFVIVFIVIAIIARRRPVLAVVLGTIAGGIAAAGYLLLGGA